MIKYIGIDHNNNKFIVKLHEKEVLYLDVLELKWKKILNKNITTSNSTLSFSYSLNFKYAGVVYRVELITSNSSGINVSVFNPVTGSLEVVDSTNYNYDVNGYLDLFTEDFRLNTKTFLNITEIDINNLDENDKTIVLLNVFTGIKSGRRPEVVIEGFTNLLEDLVFNVNSDAVILPIKN